MNISGVIPFDIENGPNIGFTMFVSGCTHKCKGCHSAFTWDFNYGQELTEKRKSDYINHLQKNENIIKRFTLSGGDPLCLPQDDIKMLIDFIKRIKSETKISQFWMWTGFTLEEIRNDPVKISLVKEFDVVVDGPFVEKLRDISLVYSGSSNQRVIDVKKTIEQNTIVLYQQPKD